MKYTLLDLTQTVLSSLDADEVNSIDSTIEAQQVVKIIQRVYFDIVERANLPEHYGLVNLTASGTTTKPVLMYIPDTVQNIMWIKYDCMEDDETAMNFKDIEYLPLEYFVAQMHQKDEDDTEVLSLSITEDGHTFEFLYTNDAAPKYWTTFNDHTIIFDSYDSAVDSTLQSSKTMCFAKKVISWTNSNTFTPSLDDNQFQLLLNEATSLAWVELKQSPHPKAEQSAKRQWVRSQSTKYRQQGTSYEQTSPNFGRK